MQPSIKSLLTESYVVHTAQTEAEREAVFRIRYEVFVAEQGKTYLVADHEARRFREDLDEEGVILCVQDSGRTVGTLRVNWLPSERLLAHYSEVLKLDLFQMIDPARICVCSRLAVEPVRTRRSWTA